MNLTLHAATLQVRELLDQIDPETGELPAELEQARAVVATKATAVTAYILESERMADSADEYCKALASRIKTQRRRVEWLRTYLREHMQACGIQKIADERGIFSAALQAGRDEAVEVFDAAQVPTDYLREIPAKYEPDKTLIRRAIKDGYDVPGARIALRDRLTIK